MHKATIAETDTHKYLILPREELQTFNLNFQCALNSFAADDNIRVLLNSILPFSLIFDPINPLREQLAWPNCYNGIADELYYVTAILVNGLGHNVEEFRRLFSELFIENLFTLEVTL